MGANLLNDCEWTTYRMYRSQLSIKSSCMMNSMCDLVDVRFAANKTIDARAEGVLQTKDNDGAQSRLKDLP